MKIVKRIQNKMVEQGQPHRKRKYFIIAIVIFMILIIGFLNYRYIQNATRDSYIQGGADAIDQIMSLSEQTGGVILETKTNETLILAKYNKETTPPIVGSTNTNAS
jgi:hypothetical protein